MDDLRYATKRVVRSFFLMLLLSMIVAVFGWWLAIEYNKHFRTHPDIISFLEFLGYICWGTSLGSKREMALSKKESTHAETISQRLVVIISLLGIFVFVLAQFLLPPD